MSTDSWAGASGGSASNPKSGSWGTRGNWSLKALPVGGDDVVLPQSGTNGAYTLTYNLTSAQPKLGSVTVNSGATLAVGANSLLVNNTTVGSTTDLLSIASGGKLTLAGGSLTAGGINVAGTLTGAGTITIQSTGTTAHTIRGTGTITASGGTLDLVGTVASGLTFTIATGSASDLKFDGAAAISAISIANANQTLEIGSSGNVTIAGAQTVALGKILLSGGALTDSSGIVLGSGANSGAVKGYGTVAANVTRGGTGTANTITASGGGTLDIQGTIGNGVLVAIDATAANTLKLEGVAAVNAFTLNNANQTLSVGAALTVTGAQTVTNGTVLLSGGGTIADSAGLTIGAGGKLTGQGTVTANIGAGTGTITASGGTLHLAGSVASGPTLAIADIANSRLSIEGTATAAAPIAIDTANKTLAIASTGNLTISGGSESISNGTITLAAGGQVTDTAGFLIGSGAMVIGAGKITGSISGGGIVEASGGTLELATALPTNAATGFEIANNTASVLELDALPGDGATFTFLGANGRLALKNAANIHETIAGLAVGAGAPANLIDFEGQVVVLSSVAKNGNSGTLTLSNGAVLSLTNIGAATWYATTASDDAGGTELYLTDTVPCYCRGTRIRTPQGEIAVEQLQIGDLVTTISGEAKPIRWIGKRSYGGRFIRSNRNILPVCIAAGALADGVPVRDLWVSPGHSLFFEGSLVPAEHLIDGATITQADSVEQLDYFHIELDAHDILFAEGAAAESYLECDNRRIFANATAYSQIYPKDERPGWRFCAPVRGRGSPEVSAVRRRLAERAISLGHAFVTDPGLRLIVDDEAVLPETVQDGEYSFRVPGGARDVLLASRHAVPREAVADSEDPRRLGVAIERMVLRDANTALDVLHGHPALCDGFHGDEPTHRWTDGLARLPDSLLGAVPGPFALEIHLRRETIGLPYSAAAPIGKPGRARPTAARAIPIRG